MVESSFLHVNYLHHIKLDHGLIHALIEQWKRETHKSNILFNFINETFFIPQNDGVRRPCRENIHSIYLVVYYSIISHGDMFSCFK
uniref:Aminotransferase-like plant mobile domain-containing protein n=1 Tax=Salix viminalis TaxID=40686 RepID=A0A6N2NF90_SALVM